MRGFRKEVGAKGFPARGVTETEPCFEGRGDTDGAKLCGVVEGVGA